jgi:antitoxin (DNA-binding transcriptional repressor) of toxin-antitoxin stability system
VTVNTTEFRKNLFTLVDRALRGELVEISHKGQTIRLVPTDMPSKMSRLIQRNTVNGSLDDLAKAQQELDHEMRQSWDSKWA